MQEPKRTTELMSEDSSVKGANTHVYFPVSEENDPLCLIVFRIKDTNEGGGGNGQNGSHRNGFLGISQVSRPVGACHDACTRK